MGHLIPCSGCARHVRADDSLCPFCGETLPLSLRSREPNLPAKRLGRAATFAFGAAIAASTATACGTTVTPADAGNETDAGQVEEDAGGVSPLYGGPPLDAGDDTDAGPDESDAGSDAGNVAPPYGLPPVDAGPIEADAGTDAGNVAPPYGLPPVDAGPDAGGGITPAYGAPAYGAPPES